MAKRRRLLTSIKNRGKSSTSKAQQQQVQVESPTAAEEKEVSTPRRRLKGALLDALEPATEESDTSLEPSPVKRERRDYTSDDEDKYNRAASPPRQSYVLKLFDRSVDLSQFSEDSPLYPICRAWITNQPKANYKDFGLRSVQIAPSDLPQLAQHFYSKNNLPLDNCEESVELPGPEGPPISKIPDLTPEQMTRNKDNINLNYRDAPPPSREQLLEQLSARWAGVRGAWRERGARVERRYEAAQRVLSSINANAM